MDAFGYDPDLDCWWGMYDPATRSVHLPVKLGEAVEAVPEGETVVIDLGLGLAARPFDADR